MSITSWPSNIDHEIGSAATTQATSGVTVTSDKSSPPCPATYEFTMTQFDDSALPSPTFTFDGTTLTINTADRLLADTYPLTLEVAYTSTAGSAGTPSPCNDPACTECQHSSGL